MNITGAEWLVQCLEDQGVTCVAGVPGGAVLPLYDALSRSTRIRHVLARHEQGAAFIAQGMARSTGRASVCLASSGPGATNLLTSIADAKHDSVPLICITGQVPTSLIGTDAFQEVATIELAKPITKGCFFVADAAEIGTTLAKAFALAESGRPGPVLIDIPKDVQLASVTPATSFVPHPARRAPPDTSYDTVAEWLMQAERPLLYVGGGVVKARAQAQVRQLSEQTNVPVVATLMALGVMPPRSPLNLGMLGMHGARFTNAAIDECDLLLTLGARFDDRATGRVAAFAPRARIVHIDIDPRELGKIKPADFSIVDDAAHAASELLARTPRRERAAWLERLTTLRSERPLKRSPLCTMLRSVAEIAGPDVFVTTDVGQHQMWVAQHYPFERADRWLTSGGLGTMGFGLPAAIGAALAHPSATALCFTGDGSLLMNIQELATLAELQANVKVILLDNAALGLVHQQQQLFYGGNLLASRYDRPSDFLAIARAFGIEAMQLESLTVTELTEVLQRPGPALLRMKVDASSHVMPMVAPGAANVDALDNEEMEVSDYAIG